jgi:hypothetical protein
MIVISKITQIRKEWKELWSQKFEDDLIAEDIARRDYPLLFIEQGTVVRATRKYRHIEFDDIIEKHQKSLGSNLINPPHPEIGGWGKFIKTKIRKPSSLRNMDRKQHSINIKSKKQHEKKGGRGWLHKI